MSKVIEEKVKEFIGSNKMFTSVDIANSIKQDKVWIKNSDVASFLRANIVQLSSGQYNKILVDVLGGSKKANLYYPIGTDPFDYKDLDQVALTPVDIGVDPDPVAGTQTIPPINTISGTSNVNSGQSSDPRIKVRPDSQCRLRIPAVLVKQIGLNPGDHVDKSKILVNNKDISTALTVRSDGRIEISRECVAWGDGPVYVVVKNNVICFEKC